MDVRRVVFLLEIREGTIMAMMHDELNAEQAEFAMTMFDTMAKSELIAQQHRQAQQWRQWIMRCRMCRFHGAGQLQ